MSKFKMEEVSQAELLSLNFSENVRKKLENIFASQKYYAVVAYNDEGRIKAVVFEEPTDEFPDNAIAFVRRRSGAVKSRTARAVDLVLNHGYTAYGASKEIGISPQAVHRALDRRKISKYAHAVIN